VSELRIVRTLLWDHLASRLPAAEHDTVRRAVGEQLVLDNEALLAEADALGYVLETIRLRADEAARRRRRVLENPARRLVEIELGSLLRRLGHARGGDGARQGGAEARAARALSVSRSGRGDGLPPRPGGPPGVPLDEFEPPPPGPDAAGPTSRPGSSGRLSRPASTRPSTAASNRPSTASSTGAGLAEMVRRLEGRVNAAGIDVVATELRELFQQEAEALRDDIEFLTSCAEGALDEVLAGGFEGERVPWVGEMEDLARELREEADEADRRRAAELAAAGPGGPGAGWGAGAGAHGPAGRPHSRGGAGDGETRVKGRLRDAVDAAKRLNAAT